MRFGLECGDDADVAAGVSHGDDGRGRGWGGVDSDDPVREYGV